MSKLKNWEITDRVVYKTTHWTIETHPEDGEADTYYIQCQEGDTHNTWFINSDLGGSIDVDSELGQELVERCETYEDWRMDNDDRFDVDGGYNG